MVVAVSSRMNFWRQVTVCLVKRHKDTTTIIAVKILESKSLENFILPTWCLYYVQLTAMI